MKHKPKESSKNVVNYTRPKNAYDGNMEITNLKSTKSLETPSDTEKK